MKPFSSILYDATVFASCRILPDRHQSSSVWEVTKHDRTAVEPHARTGIDVLLLAYFPSFFFEDLFLDLSDLFSASGYHRSTYHGARTATRSECRCPGHGGGVFLLFPKVRLRSQISAASDPGSKHQRISWFHPSKWVGHYLESELHLALPTKISRSSRLVKSAGRGDAGTIHKLKKDCWSSQVYPAKSRSRWVAGGWLIELKWI